MNMKYAMGATRFTLVLTAVGMMGLSGAAIAGAAPRIDRPQAERIALAHAPGGTIRNAELEHEKGQPVWSFDITRAGTTDITEVLVNADTGAVVEVSTETAAQQRAEAREDTEVED